MSTLAFDSGLTQPHERHRPARLPAKHVLRHPEPATVPQPDDETAVHDALHPGVLAIMSGCFGTMMLAFWLTFRGSTEALFSVMISLVYLAMYLGTPWVVLRCRAAHEVEGEQALRGLDLDRGAGFGTFLRGRMHTATGPLTGWEVVAQACSIPFAVMIATIGICIVIAMT